MLRIQVAVQGGGPLETRGRNLAHHKLRTNYLKDTSRLSIGIDRILLTYKVTERPP